MPRLTITLPEKIYKQIKTRAEKNLRTISNQIAYELQHPDILPKPVSAPESKPVSVPDTTQTVFTSPTPENPTGQSHTPTADTTKANRGPNRDHNRNGKVYVRPRQRVLPED